MLGLILLWTGHIEILLSNGSLELSEKCFQDLLLKDQNHPAALINYGAFLSCQFGAVIPGAGTGADKEAWARQAEAADAATRCLAEVLKADPKCGPARMSLANARDMAGDHRGAGRQQN